MEYMRAPKGLNLQANLCRATNNLCRTTKAQKIYQKLFNAKNSNHIIKKLFNLKNFGSESFGLYVTEKAVNMSFNIT